MSGDRDSSDIMRELCAHLGVEVWEGEEAEAAADLLFAAAPIRFMFSRRDYVEAHRENEGRDRERRAAEREREVVHERYKAALDRLMTEYAQEEGKRFVRIVGNRPCRQRL